MKMLMPLPVRVSRGGGKIFSVRKKVSLNLFCLMSVSRVHSNKLGTNVSIFNTECNFCYYPSPFLVP